MLQTKIVSDTVCAVSYSPTEILVRNRGKQYYGKEKMLVALKGNKLIVCGDVASEFGVEILVE